MTIKKKPNLAITRLASPKRQPGSRIMKATWAVPASLVKESNEARATGQSIEWSLNIPGKDPKKVLETANEKLTASSINLNNLTIGKRTYTRGSFYPLHKSRKLYSVTVKVAPTNSKGRGPAVSATRKFTTPRRPSISAFSFNHENGELSCTIVTDAGADHRERYDTRYQVYIVNTRTGGSFYHKDTSSTATSIGVTFDASDYQQLPYDQYICVKVTAWARGLAGDSEKVERTFYISYPAKATIVGVEISAKDSTGKATVTIKTNSSAQHPVDRVKLEYLANTIYSDAAEIPGDVSPTETNITDDAQCSALAMPVADLIPDTGKYTWLRVKSWHAAETVLYRYSEWVRVLDLETPAKTAADDEITILSAAAGENGTSAVVRLGWNKSGTDDATATELSWDDDEDAWKSTKPPSSYVFDWSDGPVTVGGETYGDSATISIKGLEEATRYFIKSRRVLEGEATTFSPYSNPATVLTSERPETVTAICDKYVPTGKALLIYWTFSGNALQAAWQILSAADVVLASGEGSITSTQISADRLAQFAENNQITLRVEVSTGSGFVASEDHTITIMNAPEINVNISSPLTAQPLSLEVTADALCDLIVIVSSQGASGQFPAGIKRQTLGDTIHSDVYAPEWQINEATGTYNATITLPHGLDLWDLGSYTVEVVGVDRVTSLRSTTIEKTFETAWTHQAPDPYSFISITPIDTIDEEGFHRMATEIELMPPDDAAESDLYDIYRLTGDEAVLIGEGFPLTCTAHDEYAPFAAGRDLAYRIAIRTTDGDVEFTDIPYKITNESLRFDWPGGSLELPYNLQIGDTYKKDVEIRQHMDGSVDGYWNKGVIRTSSLSTDVIKLTQQRDMDQARQLARYAGPVFVRTPEGSAYEADVQVSDMSSVNKSVMAIAIDATETGLTQGFTLPTPYAINEEAGG